MKTVGIRHEKQEALESWHQMSLFRATVLAFTIAFGVESSASAQSQTINGDLTIHSSGPVIYFENTFASRTWSVNNSGPFRIIDETAQTVPFLIQAGAPGDSLDIAGNGNIGIGTSSPLNVANIHVLSPRLDAALMLESPAQGQFPNQKWLMDGSWGGFGIEDYTAQTVPFQLQSTAPTSSLSIASNGNIGFGTSSPAIAANLHVYSPRLDAALLLDAPDPNNANVRHQWIVDGSAGGLSLGEFSRSTTPFFINASAPTSSMVIDSSGHTGLGTDSPGADLHVKSMDLFTTIRLETTNPVSQAWELSGGGSSFDVVDHTNADAIPLGVASGAPTNSLFVASSGQVGLGTSTPAGQLHARKKAQTGIAETLARFEITDDSIGRLDINNASSTNGVFIPRMQGRGGSTSAAFITEGIIASDSGSNPVIVYNAARAAGGAVSTRPLVVYRNNNTAKVTIAANGNITATSFINASSRELKDKIADLDSHQAHVALQQLTPVQFVYKDDPSEDLRVGFIAEDVPDLIAEPERKSVPVMDVVALVTRVVKDQQQTIDQQKATIEAQRRELKMVKDDQKSLSERLSQLEQLLSAKSDATSR